MKKIKVKFTGFWEEFNPDDNFLTDILKKHFSVQLSDTPDYVISSVLGTPYEYCNYRHAVRILFSGENYSADFNLFDYAIGFDRCSYGDRYLRYPLYLLYQKDLQRAEEKHKNDFVKILECKTRFCNLVYGHDTDDFQRKRIFEKLSEYKKVDSGGTYLNNMGGEL